MKKGNVVLVKKDVLSLNLKKGDIGVVYDTYPDFDIPVKNGVSVIFENGNNDIWSIHDQNSFLLQIGHEVKHADYDFENVAQLKKDFEDGYWDFEEMKKKHC